MKIVASALFALTVAILSSGCNQKVENVWDRIQGFNFGLTCDIDAMFNTSNCRPRGRIIIRKAASEDVGLDVGTITIRIDSSAVLRGLPTTATLKVVRADQLITSGDFSLMATNSNEVKFSDSAAANQWLNTYAQANDAISYELSGATVGIASGTNTVTATVNVFGVPFASASENIYAPRGSKTPEQQ